MDKFLNNDFSEVTFFEQIVSIKKTGLDILKLFGIWLLAAVLAFIGFIFLTGKGFFIFGVAIVALVFYGAFWLSKSSFVEYEYIVTNGTLDIDKIIAKSKRKRVMSIEIADVASLEKFNPNKQTPGGVEKTVFACDKTDPNAYCLLAAKEGKGKQYLVFSPNEKIKKGVVKALPRFLSFSAFK